MNLESQVVSLELARKLKELLVKQESEFYLVEATSIGGEKINPVWLIAHKSQCSGIGETFISAFTVGELGEMLPETVSTFKFRKLWECMIVNNPSQTEFLCKKEADARAKMLIYLIENKLIKVEDINAV